MVECVNAFFYIFFFWKKKKNLKAAFEETYTHKTFAELEVTVWHWVIGLKKTTVGMLQVCYKAH